MFSASFRIVAAVAVLSRMVRPLWSRFLCLDVEPTDAAGVPMAVDADGKPLAKKDAAALCWSLVARLSDKVLVASESDKNAPAALERADAAVKAAAAWQALVSAKSTDAAALGSARDAARAALVALKVDTADLPDTAAAAVKIADKRLSHAKDMRAPRLWSDDSGQSRPMILAQFASRADADKAAAALLAFYSADYDATTDAARIEALALASAEAAQILPSLVALVGVRFSGQRVCKYAERDAAPARGGKRSAEPTPTAAVNAVNKLLANAAGIDPAKRAEIEAALAALLGAGVAPTAPAPAK